MSDGVQHAVGASRLTHVDTAHGRLDLPAFLPDATRGVVRTVDAADLRAVGVPAIVVNTVHLASNPGISTVRGAGGIQAFTGFDGPVVSDSGGFQVWSLIGAGRGQASVTAAGFKYRLRESQAPRLLTPEACTTDQLRLGSDITFALDYCTHPSAPADEQERSVEWTIAWAARARRAYDEQVSRDGNGQRPLLFAVVQGGSDPALRRRCAEALLEIGFDGYGFGGWPIDDDGSLLDMVAEVASLLPPDAPRHALGIGRPENVEAAWSYGYSMFDCTLPTRVARRGRLYVQPDADEPLSEGRYKVVDAADARWFKDRRPVDATCDCPCCSTYSRAYLSHLFRIEDALALRLATLHNLRFYQRLMAELRARRPA